MVWSTMFIGAGEAYDFRLGSLCMGVGGSVFCVYSLMVMSINLVNLDLTSSYSEIS